MKYAPIFALALAACTDPAPICDRSAQEWDKYGTQEDQCQTPANPWLSAPAPTGIDYSERRERRMGDKPPVVVIDVDDLRQARIDTRDARRAANDVRREARELLDRARNLGANLTTIRALEDKLKRARFDARLAANAEAEAGARLKAFLAGGL